jgi:hypothetical protein
MQLFRTQARSYLGGSDQIIDKITTFSHVGYDRPEYKNKDRVERCVRDLFGRPFDLAIVDLDDSYLQKCKHLTRQLSGSS